MYSANFWADVFNCRSIVSGFRPARARSWFTSANTRSAAPGKVAAWARAPPRTMQHAAAAHAARAKLLGPIDPVLAARRLVDADPDLGKGRVKDVGAVAGAVHPGSHHRLRVRLSSGNVLTPRHRAGVAGRLLPRRRRRAIRSI